MEMDALRKQIEAAKLDPDLEPDPFEPLDTIVEQAEELGLLPLALQVTEAAVVREGIHPAHYYIYASAQFRTGQVDAAHKHMLSLCGRLETDQSWRALALLSSRILEESPRVEAALFLAKALENAGIDLVEPTVLRNAYDQFPGESRLAYLMGESREKEARDLGFTSDEAKKKMTEARFFWAEALDGFITHRKNDQIEDIFEKLAGSSNPDTLRRGLAGLKKLAHQEAWGRFQSSADTLVPALERANLLDQLWRILLDQVAAAPAGVGIRQRLADLASRAFPHAEGIAELIERTGILDPTKPVDLALKDLEPLISFAPGFFVFHDSWGVGKVQSNDGDSLVIDFEERAGHRMSVNLARRALDVIPADDLRVLRREAAGELRQMTKDNPGEVVYLAIRQLRGQTKTQDLKRILTDGVIAPSRWSAWWKEAKAQMEQDDRFDLSQAFRQVYKIKTGVDSTEVAFPIVEPRRGIRPNLNLIRRFLDQHPALTEHAKRMYTKILERWARDEKTHAEDRMAIHFQLYRWHQETSQEFHDALREMLQQGVEATSFTDVEDQKLLTRVGLGYDDLWKETAYFALSSRFADVRQMALEKLETDKEQGRALLRGLIEHPAELPLAALAAINLSIRRRADEDSIAPDIWHAALGAATLIESTSREQVRKLALTMMLPEGVLASKLAQETPDEVIVERFGFLLRRWRSSERFLQPVLRLLRQVGLEQIVEEFRTEQVAKTNLILQSHAHAVDYSGNFMTRATFERLRRDLERMNFELKTTVAQAIQKARELGDLRENAEFAAAKQKQADYMERIGSLSARLGEARMIDDLKLPEGEVGPGVVVSLEDIHSRDVSSYWVLGEGDDVFGGEVLSYASPLGREMLGRKVGERISIITDSGPKELLIRHVERKVPEVQETPAR